jgi:hypothetical protein
VAQHDVASPLEPGGDISGYQLRKLAAPRSCAAKWRWANEVHKFSDEQGMGGANGRVIPTDRDVFWSTTTTFITPSFDTVMRSAEGSGAGWCTRRGTLASPANLLTAVRVCID